MAETRRIGVMVNTRHPHADDQELYRGILVYSEEHPGFECTLAPFAAEDLAGSPRRRPPYDAVLAQATPELVQQARRSRVPVVDVWRDSPVGSFIPCVFPDFTRAGRMAAEHLSSRGFEHFAYVVSKGYQGHMSMCDVSLDPHTADMWGGPDYAASLSARGLSCTGFLAPGSVDQDADTWSQWTHDIREWISKLAKPLALFVPQDLLCRYIADLAMRMGLRVPHDLGLVCADNEPNFCERMEPSLSAVDLDFCRVGYEAAARIDRILAGERVTRADRIMLVEPRTLIPRHSTDAVVIPDPLASRAMRFILEHSHEPIQVGDVARAVAAGRRTLERRFRDVMGRTVLQEITRCRLDRLKRRLVESDELIKVLAVDSGFNNVRMLYETFLREVGMSPSTYRARRRLSS